MSETTAPVSVITLWEREREQAQIDFFVEAVKQGRGVQFTLEPSTSRNPGDVSGYVSIESHTPFARQIAERAERRTSTATV